ncbi:MAG: class I SAM-dependent methyltransferase [Pseudomonadota bacterium]
MAVSTSADQLTIDIRLHFDCAEVTALKSAFEFANEGRSDLPGEVLNMPGMSGQRYRSLINRLVKTTHDAAYLEVGSWKGSTACAAMTGNAARVMCIDNWSLFGGPRDEFFANIERWRTPEVRFDFIETDFRDVDYAAHGQFNIYFFDGPHSLLETYEGIVGAQDALTKVHTLIIDDWNWPQVRHGTYRALEDLEIEILARLVIHTTADGTHPPVAREKSDWHNGYFIAVCRKAEPCATGPSRQARE